MRDGERLHRIANRKLGAGAKIRQLRVPQMAPSREPIQR